MNIKTYLLLTYWIQPRVKVYHDDLNDTVYICDAEHWASISDPLWRVRKLTMSILESWLLAHKDIMETDWYKYSVPNLGAVQLLNYN